MIGFDNIRVNSPYSIKEIEDLRIEYRLNEHGNLYLKGIVDDTINFSTTIKASLNDEIHIYEICGENEKTIFKGLVASVKTTNIGGVYYIEIEGISGSFHLDIQKKSRSFQDINMEYPKLIKEIIKTYPGHNFINSIGEGVKIDSPIFQYNETDWELIKRLASNFNSVIACDIMEKSPRLYFGLPRGKEYILPDDIPYTASKDLSAFMKAGGYDAGFHDTDFFYYEIESGDHYKLGDEIEFRQKKIYVSQITAYIDKGLLKYKYRLSRIKGIRQNTIYNEKLKGASLEGKVLECKGELVKLHLKIDTEQEKSKACWFPFAPPTGNIMYCLPKVGTDASLYFSDDTGNNAKVLGCLRKNGGSCTKTGNPSNRYFGTEHGSELEITPSAINIVSGCTEPLKLSFDDDTGVTITSHKKLTLNAGQEISFLTPKRITINAQSQIFMKRTNMITGLSIENNHNFLGNDFIADGSDRSTYSPFNDEPTVATDEQVKKAEEEKEEEDGFNWGKLIGNVVAALVVVAVVAVVAVAVVATGGAALAAVGVIAAGTASTAATVAGVGALVVGTAAVANLAVSDIQRGEVSDIGTYISTGAKKACMGAVFGAMFGPVGIAVETVLSIGSVSDDIDNAMQNIDNTFDEFNKEFGIDNPIIRRAEGLVGGTGKFVWGFIKSTEFIGETFYDMAAFDIATIGNGLGLVSDEETDELRDKFNVDKDAWKQVPEAINNSVNNVVVNAPRFLFDPNMTEKEASDFVNDALMTAVVVKGTVDIAKAIEGKVPEVINKESEVLGPKEVLVTPDGQRIKIGKDPMEPGGGNKIEPNQQQKDYWKAIEEGKKREIADQGVSNPKVVKTEGNRIYYEDGTIKYKNSMPEDVPQPIRTKKYHKVGDKYKDSRGYPARGINQFVITEDGNVIVGQGGHIDLSQGENVLYAGELTFNNKGVFRGWSNNSGHYKPLAGDAEKCVEILKNNRFEDVNMENFTGYFE